MTVAEAIAAYDDAPRHKIRSADAPYAALRRACLVAGMPPYSFRVVEWARDHVAKGTPLP